MSFAKTKRNQSLYQDFLSKKFSVRQLLNKYKVSQSRFYEIIKNQQPKPLMFKGVK